MFFSAALSANHSFCHGCATNPECQWTKTWCWPLSLKTWCAVIIIKALTVVVIWGYTLEKMRLSRSQRLGFLSFLLVGSHFLLGWGCGDLWKDLWCEAKDWRVVGCASQLPKACEWCLYINETWTENQVDNGDRVFLLLAIPRHLGFSWWFAIAHFYPHMTIRSVFTSPETQDTEEYVDPWRHHPMMTQFVSWFASHPRFQSTPMTFPTFVVGNPFLTFKNATVTGRVEHPTFNICIIVGF